MINRIVNKDIYYSPYVMLISSVEDYFNKIIRLLLLYDNRRIKNTLNNKFEKTIGIVEFIDNSKEEIRKILKELKKKRF